MRIESGKRGAAIVRAALLVAVICPALPTPAEAALGGSVATVEADAKQMRATRVIESKANYSVHEITTPSGTVVREYLTPSGMVFAVAWRGPFLPNFNQLLGSYYEEFARAAEEARGTQAARARTASLSIEHTSFVMHSVGHTRAYAGHAYLPAMLPAGVKAQQIR